MTTVEAAKIVAGRELRIRLRDKTFLISTAFFLLIAVASTVLPSVLGGGATKVATADRTVATALQQAELEVQIVATDAEAEQLVRDGDVDGAVVAGPAVVGLEETPNDIVQALSTSPPVKLLDPDATDPFVAFVVPFALAFLFFMTSFTFGLQIATSVTEEKQTRIVEILVASVPVRALLAGKVAAMTLLAFGQIALIAVVAFAGMQIAGVDASIVNQVGPTIAWFLPFFLIGFVMLATLWAGVGALAARQEDLNGASAPLQLVVMGPFFAVLFLQENAAAMTALSYIPFSAPIAMPVRLFTGDAAMWEPVVSLVLLVISTLVFLGVGARLYEGSLLRTNGRTAFATAWRSKSTVG